MADEIIHGLFQEDMKQLRAQIEQLQETVKTLRELREHDCKEIERLREVIYANCDPAVASPKDAKIIEEISDAIEKGEGE